MKGALPSLLYAGFDGGGTRTTCVLSDSRGTVLGVGVGGRANYHDLGVRGALDSLQRAFERAVEQHGVAKDRVHLEACFGLAGLDSLEDLATMVAAIRSMRLAGRRMSHEVRDLVVNDWRTALAGAFIDEPGVTLIAGTGCVAAAQREAGRSIVRVGGWGHVVDDRGSGYDIGREALYAAMRDYDGRGPRTRLTGLLMKRLHVPQPLGIIARVYAGEMRVPEIAALAPLVSKAASEGDAVATEVLRAKGKILGELAVSAASRLRMLEMNFGVSLHGGVFKAGPPLLGPLQETIQDAAPLAKIVDARLPPACGAVILLLRRARLEVDSRLVARMQSSLKRAVGSGKKMMGEEERR